MIPSIHQHISIQTAIFHVNMGLPVSPSASGGTILVFHRTIDFFVFFTKNRRFNSTFRQTYKEEYNYQHPAIIGRTVMQLGRLGVHQFHSI